MPFVLAGDALEDGMARKGRKRQREKTSKTERGRMKERQILPQGLCKLSEEELEHKRLE